MASAPPVADTKKPAPKPPEKKDGQAAGAKDTKPVPAKQEGGAQKATATSAKPEGKAGAAGGDKASQQRMDRMAVRAKLSVSEPGDAVEKEADQVADKVTQRLNDPKAGAAGAPSTGEPLKVQRRSAGVMREAAVPTTDQSDHQQIKGRSGAADPQQRLRAQAGQGHTLPEALRARLEGQFGQDLSAVRLHTDTEADALARDYRAEAFTVGNDIYFASGRYKPETPAGLNLLAHELTHVVQQDAPTAAPGQAMGRRVLRKPAPAAAAPSAGGAGSASAGVVDHANKTIHIPVLEIPSYDRKATATGPQPKLPKNYVRPNDQRHVWGKGIMESGGYADAVMKGFDKRRGKKNVKTGKMVHVLKPKAGGTYVIGDADTLPAKLALPRWDKNGASSQYDVDHKREMQLSGTNDIGNMELLDASANRSSGSLIAKEWKSKLAAAIQPEIGPGKHWPKAPALNDVRATYQVQFDSTSPSLTVAGNPANFWSVDAIAGGEHVKAMDALTAAQIEAKGLLGDETHLVIYSRISGGFPQTVSWQGGAPTAIPKDMFTNFDVNSISYTPGGGGSIHGIKSFKKDLLRKEPLTWTLAEMEGMDYTVYVDRASVEKSLLKMNLPGASPVTLSDVDLDDRGAVSATGVLQPDLPLLRGLSLDLSVVNDQVWLSKTFDGPELKFPGPIQVTASTLTLSAGTGGLKVEGDVDYEITRLGKGRISGLGTFGGATGGAFGLKGYFELDKAVFDGEARIEAGYENEAFWAKGHLSIADGKVRGIQSASIDASFAQDAFSATGTVVPKIPAVESASLGIDYSEAAGLKFTGDLGFKSNPLITGGKLHIEAAQPAGGTGFTVKGNGSATPNIPGVKSELTADYDDGAFNANFSGAYAKGMMSGQISVGVTNRSVDEQGNLGPLADPEAPLTVYGSGSATLRIAPWLQGTAGIRFSPTGEVTVSGDIGLPGEVQLFARQEINKSLFSLSTQIPIVPGIVAEVGGSLSAKAGIGPGVLDQMRIHVDYNPAHEENTHVTGDAHLNVPADAGLRLAARAGIGLGITGASATGGLELGGSLGIDGAAEAGVHVDWMPSQGLRIDANAAFHAQPKFKFDVSGYVAVTALGFSVYDQRWQLAAYELGSNLRFGVNFPVHYVEGQPFSVSMSDVEFEVPDVDPADMIRQVGNAIF
jgi:hypothetical protein